MDILEIVFLEGILDILFLLWTKKHIVLDHSVNQAKQRQQNILLNTCTRKFGVNRCFFNERCEKMSFQANGHWLCNFPFKSMLTNNGSQLEDLGPHGGRSIIWEAYFQCFLNGKVPCRCCKQHFLYWELRLKWFCIIDIEEGCFSEIEVKYFLFPDESLQVNKTNWPTEFCL